MGPGSTLAVALNSTGHMRLGTYRSYQPSPLRWPRTGPLLLGASSIPRLACSRPSPARESARQRLPAAHRQRRSPSPNAMVASISIGCRDRSKAACRLRTAAAPTCCPRGPRFRWSRRSHYTFDLERRDSFPEGRISDCIASRRQPARGAIRCAGDSHRSRFSDVRPSTPRTALPDAEEVSASQRTRLWRHHRRRRRTRLRGDYDRRGEQRAGVAPNTFYRTFSDKLDCYLPPTTSRRSPVDAHVRHLEPGASGTKSCSRP